jgi:uncharacterized protein YajQ (UPF0234 family)
MAAENSFDIACKIDMQEVTNGLDHLRPVNRIFTPAP